MFCQYFSLLTRAWLWSLPRCHFGIRCASKYLLFSHQGTDSISLDNCKVIVCLLLNWCNCSLKANGPKCQMVREIPKFSNALRCYYSFCCVSRRAVTVSTCLRERFYRCGFCTGKTSLLVTPQVKGMSAHQHFYWMGYLPPQSAF